jgi:hypothetical protein
MRSSIEMTVLVICVVGIGLWQGCSRTPSPGTHRPEVNSTPRPEVNSGVPVDKDKLTSDVKKATEDVKQEVKQDVKKVTKDAKQEVEKDVNQGLKELMGK